MKQFISTWILLIFGSLLFSASAQNVGAVLPDFTLSRYDGGTYQLSSQKGKVVLIFMFGYDCPTCKAAGPGIQSNLINTFSSNTKFAFVGIDTWDGTSAGVSIFKQLTGISDPLLIKGSAVASLWGTTYDRLLVADANGVLVFKGERNAANDITLAKTAIEQSLAKLQTTSSEMLQAKLENHLGQNYPNPFLTGTTIPFSIANKAAVEFEIIDITGQIVVKRSAVEYPSGNHEIKFTELKLRNGIYFIRMKTGDFVQSRKMIIH